MARLLFQIERIRPHMLLSRHYWWKGLQLIRDRFARQENVETILATAVDVVPPRPRFLTKSSQGSDECLRILYVAPRYDYGNPARGLSFEENNFWHALSAAGHELIRFDYPTIVGKHGRKAMNAMLVEAAYRYRPDVAFFVLFGGEFEEEAIVEVSRLGVPTVNWFTDDHWRFDSYSARWAPSFDWVVTTARDALPKYGDLGCERVLLLQWGCNQHLYYQMERRKTYDVSFVGQPYGNRRRVVEALRRKGIDVRTWGYGWPSGRVTQRELVEIINSSKINLNFSGSSVPGSAQVKARVFEVLGSGGFALTEWAPGLEEYYEVGSEVIAFHSTEELIEQATYYLRESARRVAIAERGYRRTLAEHTYDARFSRLFRCMGIGAL